MADDTLLWAYGVVADDTVPAIPATLRGIRGAPVRLVGAGGVSAIASAVPAGEFDEATLERRMTDLEWVGARGQEHERVLTHFADHGPTVPFSPFSLHADEERLAARLADQREVLLRALARLAGKRQWGVRVWREGEAHAAAVGRLSPAVQAADREIASAGPGRRYLLEKKRATLVAEEGARLLHAHLEEALRQLAAVADGARSLPIARGATSGATSGARQLVLDAMFLVETARYDEFAAAVNAGAARGAELGARWEFTGPWPAYHFADG